MVGDQKCFGDVESSHAELFIRYISMVRENVHVVLIGSVVCRHISAEKMTILDVCNRCKVDLYLVLNQKTWTKHP